MNSPRETIQISLGPSANAITAHLLNLQGLAATSSSNPDNAYCDPETTHYVQGGGSGTLVPRVLMVDEAKNQVAATSEQEVSQHSMHQTHSRAFDPSLSCRLYADSFWNGNLQILGDQALSASTMAARNNKRQNAVDTSQTTSPFWQAASTMAYSPYSRYHCTRESDPSAHQYRTDPNNARHVVWDENEEEEEEDPSERAFRQQEAGRRWRTNTAVDLGQELDRQMDEAFQQQAGRKSSSEEELAQSSPSATQEFYFNHWTDILMPPWNEKSKLVLPFSSQSQLVPHWNVSYQNDGNNSSSTLPFLQEWKEDTLFENLRHMLEACDHGIQGVSISTEGHGIYASLATYLLEELKQECKSAGRLVYHVKHEKNYEANATEDASSNALSSSWQEAKVDEIRKKVSSGLALFDFTEKAHAVLPLQLSGESGMEFFHETAQMATALEVSTLPFRFREKKGAQGGLYQMGLQNAPFLAHGMSDTSWGNTTARLTFSEYLQVLQPTSLHSMLELDFVSQTMDANRSITNEKLFESIQQGTSVERDQRTRESRGHSYRTRPRDVSPGSWMRDANANSNGTNGMLSSLSYSTSNNNAAKFDRSSHRHFALGASIRPILQSPSGGSNGSAMSNYLTCLIEGMGIRYRPERSIATVLNQSLGEMTFGSEGGGSNYGAGIYWKHIMPQVDTPVLSVLGNSTRAYTPLNEIATDMKVAMKTTRYRGFYNRDVVNSVLPELEDCEEALEACWNKRDVYEPPSGSGLGTEEDY